MSIQKDSYGYRVRWREGGRQRQRTFGRKRDAEAFETDVKRRRQLGALAPGVLQSRMTLAEFVEEDWWPRHAAPNLKASTKDRYLEIWGTHLLPRVGAYELRQITPVLVEDFRDQLERRGVGVATRRKALMLLQGILKRAVVRGLLPSNPVQVVDKPRQPMTRRPEPLSPNWWSKSGRACWQRGPAPAVAQAAQPISLRGGGAGTPPWSRCSRTRGCGRTRPRALAGATWRTAPCTSALARRSGAGWCGCSLRSPRISPRGVWPPAGLRRKR